MTETIDNKTATAPNRAFVKHSHPGQFQSYEEILASDTRPVPPYLRDLGESDIGPNQIPTRWYLDQEVHDLEVEHIWKRSWQLACREEDIPEVGDTFVYEVANMSFLIVREGTDSIKGYWNSCLHRGAALVDEPGRIDRIQCRFHGFTWGLDGACQLVPFPEDFPQIDKEKLALPQTQVATWMGFVFINPDPNAGSFEEYIGETAAPIENQGGYTNRHKVIHFAKIFPTNWKAVQEAFLDTFHVITTHPQFAIVNSDECSQYATWNNWSFGVLPFGQTSPYVATTPTEQEIFERWNGAWDDEESVEDITLPPGKTAREAQIDINREALRASLGPVVDNWCDSEIVDVMWYTLFPNFSPFTGMNSGMVYRFRPYGNTPNYSIMDVMVLAPIPEGADAPPSAPMHLVPDGDDFTSVPGLDNVGAFNLGSFLSQDIAIMNGMMTGIRNNQIGYVNLGRKHDVKIRHFYHLYEKSLGLSAEQEVSHLDNRRNR
ncbi:aromatic ring-hydroxylating oxygenase subunit alpha [Rhodococcus opacus]|uniref:aromatic ring-hydroxylating oxygenase subunit alpha n=1 Tax=Rhodococcus opacus TaxID=37919 RepID=UPI000B204EE6|nr:aromatic ring-hydroxylating dioxygenase subunit alpha [Rhodococcus opacus]